MDAFSLESVAAWALRPTGPAATARSPPRVTLSPMKPCMPRSLVMTSTSAVDWMPIWIPQEAPAMVRKFGPYQLPLWGSLLRSRPSP
jgi:hypothetical protein